MGAEAREVLEVRLRQRGSVAHRLFRGDRTVSLDCQRQPIVVGALADARLGDSEIGAANRIVDRVDTDDVNGKRLVHDVLIGLYVPTTATDVQLDVDVAIALQREEVLVAIDDRDATLALDVGSGHSAGRVLRNAKDGVLDALVQRQRERLEIADDLVDVFNDARDRLVLVKNAIDAEAPYRGTAERGQQETPHGVSEGVAEAALERLESEFCDVGIVFALRRFD